MFASQGYIVAIQDTRGKHESEGIFISILQRKSISITGILRFQYTGTTPQLLQFSVEDVDQIYLNSVVFFTLIVSSFRVPVCFRLKNYVIGKLLLSGIHVSLLIMYIYTNILEFVGIQPEASQKLMQSGLEILFPSGITEMFDTIIYY